MITLKTITVLETVIAFLHEKKQTIVFGYKDAPVIPLQKKLQKENPLNKDDIKYLLVDRGDNNLFYAIEIYYKETGKVPVVFATTKSEFAGLMKILGMATNRGIPVICFCGESKDNRYETLFSDNLDIHRLQRCCTKYTYEFSDMGQLSTKLKESHEISGNDKPGSVLLHVPLNLQNETIIEKGYTRDIKKNTKIPFNKKDTRSKKSIFALLDKVSQKNTIENNTFYSKGCSDKDYCNTYSNLPPEDKLTQCKHTALLHTDKANKNEQDNLLSFNSSFYANSIINTNEAIKIINVYRKHNNSLIFTSFSNNLVDLYSNIKVSKADRLITHNEAGFFAKVMNFLEILKIEKKIHNFNKIIIVMNLHKFLDNLSEFISFSNFLKNEDLHNIELDFFIINDCLYEEIKSLEYNYTKTNGCIDKNIRHNISQRPNLTLLLKSFGISVDSFIKKDNIPLSFQKASSSYKKNIRFFEFKTLNKNKKAILNI